MPYYDDPMPCPGVHRLKLPLANSPLKYVNAYLLPSSSGHLLIDTGWNTEDTEIALSRQLGAIGIRYSDIARVVITHAHIDHYGMAGKVIRRSKAMLIMHAIEEEMISLRYRHARRFACASNELLRAGGAEDRCMPDPRQMADRFTRLVECAAPDIVWQGGETLMHDGFEFRVLWTPGHSPGHICLYDSTRKLLFSGDHVLPGITAHIGISPHSGPNPLGDYTDSLKRLRCLEVELMLPGHGPPLKGFARRAKQILTHHERRKSEILQIQAEHDRALSPFEWVTAMTWYSRGRPVSWHDLRDFDQRLAITEVMAHLESLAADGRLAKQGRNGVIYFGPPI